MESKLAELIKAGKENPFFILVVKGGPIEEIEDSIKSLSTDCYDAVEFRADFGNFIGSSVFHKMQIASKLTFLKFLTDKPVILTLRTKDEGGEIRVSTEDYRDFLLWASMNLEVAAIDGELLTLGKYTAEVLEAIKKGGKLSLLSCHNFQGSLKAEEISRIFAHMSGSEADIMKVAVMADSREDAEALGEAACKFSVAGRNIIAVAMGAAGEEYRVFPEKINSIASFGTAKDSVAPGQITLKELAKRRWNGV